MTLNFPHKPEIRLENPPLNEVICQVRFPPILRIQKEEPSEYQELIRSRFPELVVELGIKFRLPGLVSDEKLTAESQPKTYKFRTIDELTMVSLAVDFFALSTNQYNHWEDFTNDLDLAYEATQQVYSPAYATRIGLRYVNRFTLENTGLDSFEQVVDLFHPDLTALLRSKAWSSPSEMLSQLVLIDNDAKLTIRTGCATEMGETFFLLDFDYFEEGKLEITNLLERLDCYHNVIYDAFRWCLRDESLVHFNPNSDEAIK